MISPRISVVLSVHNGDAYLAEALASILRQTFADFELIAVDDGSTDRTAEILASVGDPRVTVVTQPKTGLTASLNRAIALSRGELIARMDADDVAHPERFARQVAYLDAHPEVGLLGTGYREILPSGEVVRTVRPPADDGAIRRALIRRNPFVHSSVMVRRATVEKAGLYDESLPVVQDYDLWFRMSRLARMANLSDPLVLRRLTPGRVSRARDTERLRAEVAIKLRAIREGAYPLWCLIFAVKPLGALLLPAGIRWLLRRSLSREPPSREASRCP